MLPILVDQAAADYVDPRLAVLAILAIVGMPVAVASALTWCGIAWARRLVSFAAPTSRDPRRTRSVRT